MSLKGPLFEWQDEEDTAPCLFNATCISQVYIPNSPNSEYQLYIAHSGSKGSRGFKHTKITPLQAYNKFKAIWSMALTCQHTIEELNEIQKTLEI